MDNKKHPGRFTIAFNLDDERQREACEELRRHGRRKARFLADAILSYSNGQTARTGSGAEMEEIVTRCVESVLQKMHGQPPQMPDETTPRQSAPQPAPSGQQWNHEDLSVIADTLSAFQK